MQTETGKTRVNVFYIAQFVVLLYTNYTYKRTANNNMFPLAKTAVVRRLSAER